MKRRSFLQYTSLAGGLALLPWQKELLSLVLPEAGTMRPLRNNVGLYTERGGTIGWLIADGALVVVDTQFQEQSQNFINKVRETNEGQFDLLINTHHHGDHTSGNIAYEGMVKMHLAHANSKANQMRVAQQRDSEEGQMYPGETYKDTWSKRVGSEVVTLRYFGPAHTDGDSIIHFENANVAHMGDLMFNRRFPYIDKSSGASIENWIKVLGDARKTFDKDTLFIFGHSGEGYDVTGTLDDLKAMQHFFKRLLKFTKKSIKKGLSQEQVLEGLEIIPGAPEWTGGGIERNISAAYQELGGE
ncbi:MAG TPA: MBL fold metallo-hydrolase [Saprospiraceae bacterium]|nr:MBL fold metallo-hydrolase [Saprospiraceae bacterium]